MGDSNDIERLFQKEFRLPKYKTKRWVTINDQNRNVYNDSNLVKYDCRPHKEELVAYHNGYILIKGYIQSTVVGTALQNTDNIAHKNGNYSIIDHCIVKIENSTVDVSQYVYLTMTVLNLFEYSNDYAISIAEAYGFAKDNKNVAADNTGNTKRKQLLDAFATDKFPFTLKIPTIHLSPFFRRLDFPLINHAVDIQLKFGNRLVNGILRANAAPESKITIESTELVLPVVELPSDYQTKYAKQMTSGAFPMTLDWDELKVYEAPNTLKGQVNYEIDSSICGLNRLYVLAIPNDNWDKQTHIETFVNTILSNVNVVIDGEKFYHTDINDALAYELVKECFNNGGIDNDKGTCLTFIEWKTCYKIYAFDLSRQQALEHNPKKAQTLRFQCTLPAGDYKVIFIASCSKETTFNFMKPSDVKTV